MNVFFESKIGRWLIEFALFAIAIATFVGLIVLAWGLETYEENHLINVAGEQRMLSQKIAKEALLVHLGLSQHDQLLSSKKKFQDNLNEIDKYDYSSSFNAELSNLKKNWDVYLLATRDIMDNEQVTVDRLENLTSLSSKVLTDANNVVHIIEQHANKKLRYFECVVLVLLSLFFVFLIRFLINLIKNERGFS